MPKSPSSAGATTSTSVTSGLESVEGPWSWVRSPRPGGRPGTSAVGLPIRVRDQVVGRRELEDPADGGGRVDQPELLAPVVRPMLEVHYREPRRPVHERAAAGSQEDVEPPSLADQVVERRGRRQIEAPGHAQVCGAVGRLDTNGE